MEVSELSEKVCVICRLDIEADQPNSFANVGEAGIYFILI